ncbi:hypothetical protein ACQ4PT_001308 [Festuca glaucescens]
MLGRRWRDIFCSVHTISFEEVEGERKDDWYTYFWEAADQRSCSGMLLDCISSALLRRRNRCVSTTSMLPVPLRSFHFTFDSCSGWDKVAVDQWLFDVLCRSGNKELHLDLRFHIGPICKRRKDEDNDGKEQKDNEGWGYVLPTALFSCTAIRTLCLSHCKLNVPDTVDLPFLEALRLTGIRGDDSGYMIQRLVWSCSRLVDLTLEGNSRLKRLTVLDKRLRRFALQCCHNIAKVIIDASELRSLEYSGSVPEESLLSLSGSPGLASCTIRFCRVRPNNESELVGFRRFLEKVSDSKHVHLHHGGLDSRFFAVFPSFSSLKRLELQGPIQSSDSVNANGIRRILEHTPNLEVLSLYMDTNPQKQKAEPITYRWRLEELDDDDEEEEEYERSIVLDNLLVPDESGLSMPCLRHSVKEINMVNYHCDVQHRALAKACCSTTRLFSRGCVSCSGRGNSRCRLSSRTRSRAG